MKKHKPSIPEVADEILESVKASPTMTRRLRSSTFWTKFAVKHRTDQLVEKVKAALVERKLLLDVGEEALGAERKDVWIRLTLVDPPPPPPEPKASSSESSPPPTWFTTICSLQFESEREVILRVGAEGGSLTLYGARAPGGWRFSRRVIDQTMGLMDLDDGETIDEESAVVSSWPAALALLDQYPWHRLYPHEVHPEFCGRVLEAAAARHAADGDPDGDRLPRWQEICKSAGRA